MAATESLPPIRYPFPRQNRIQKRPDFQRAYAEGKCFRHKYLHMFVLALPDSPVTRLGITATRKMGKAVVRNQMKRWVREAFRLELPFLKPGYDLVINFSRTSKDADFASIQKQLRRLLEEAGLYQSTESKGITTQSGDPL